MLPGKTFTPEELLGALRQRIWLLLVPFALVAVGTAVGARFLPDKYRSETVILVVPQRVPESYVKATVTARIEDRLQSITQQILSRTRLEKIIQDFDLYPDRRRTGVMEDVVEYMRTQIDVRVVKGDAFRVSYVGDNARTVMQVVERLTSLFIDENLRDRAMLAEGTNEFLEAQLEDARRQLIEHEKKLEAYRKQYAGELPSQLESNLRVMQNTQMQVQALVESVNRDQDRRLLAARQLEELERQLEAEYQSPDPVPVAAPAGDPTATGTIQEQLASARAAAAALERRYKPDHPNLRRMYRIISELEARGEVERAAAPEAADAAPVRAVSPREEAQRKRISELRAEIEQLDRQLAFKQSEEARLRGIIALHQQRVDMAPTRESEMAELTRDYQTLQNMYDTLLMKKQESRIAANLERQQIGEQFKLLDPARVAEKPFSPKRHLINAVGMAAGLALGLLLVALDIYRDRSLKTTADVAGVLALPVLAVVPMIETPVERRRTRLRHLAVSGGLGSLVVACLSVVAYTFFL